SGGAEDRARRADEHRSGAAAARGAGGRMSFLRRHAVPFAAGVAAAAAAFAVIAVTTDSDSDERSSGAGQQAAVAAPVGPGVPEGHEAGFAVFNRMGCGGCHVLAAAGSSGPIGPDLDERLDSHTRESLTAAILSPPSWAAMPDNFGERMTDAELDALVDFLLAVR
ncbi:MAG TPA: cytochrome c, partial [Thermoleophilaceae bacterium]|nr:cytochrome c [Thermoleophilaceae bacterium]